MSPAESWIHLMPRSRLGLNRAAGGDPSRTEFQRDFDRLVFSSAFRRMQGKTQVFPLAENDYVRTRLTHSLEASSVGRTLGTLVGEAVIARHGIPREQLVAADFGAVVAAACLAHDLGNPPFGHSGEDAIQTWFEESLLGRQRLAQLTPAEQADMLKFEGNAQGFRIVARLQSPDTPGGMQLTCATLAAYSKYPRASQLSGPTPTDVASKKHGFFMADAELFRRVADETGLHQRPGEALAWQRHPLAWLVEAADDICYRIIDIEDGYREGHLSYGETTDLLLPLAGSTNALHGRLRRLRRPSERVELLRAKAINRGVDSILSCFLDQEQNFLDGDAPGEILGLLPLAEAFATLMQVAKSRLYFCRPVVEIATAGFEVLGGLLSIFVGAVEDVAERGEGASTRSRMLLHLLPEGEHAPALAPYQRLLAVTDFVSGMTDAYAVSLYKKLTGISLPGR